jgi:hypothetical protein
MNMSFQMALCFKSSGTAAKEKYSRPPKRIRNLQRGDISCTGNMQKTGNAKNIEVALLKSARE